MSRPTVSIGLPVFNGERHLAQALDSLLAQQWGDFELNISDNGSTDATGAICRGYALKDKRIKYHHSKVNQGAVWNFNNVFQLSSADLFMWASHDDYWHPLYLQSCQNVLRDSPSVVVVGSACDCIDAKQSASLFIDPGLNTVGLKPQERFKRYKKIVRDPRNMNAIFYGVYRRNALSKLMPLKKVLAADHLVLAGLALAGEFFTIPEVLMTKRGGGDSTSLERVARNIPVTNPLLVRYPHLVREFILQGMILRSDQLGISNKLALSSWSLSDFLKCSLFNRTGFIRERLKLV